MIFSYMHQISQAAVVLEHHTEFIALVVSCGRRLFVYVAFKISQVSWTSPPVCARIAILERLDFWCCIPPALAMSATDAAPPRLCLESALKYEMVNSELPATCAGT